MKGCPNLVHYDLLLDFSAFSRPVLLQFSDDLARRVLLPECPQVLCRQRGAVSFYNKPAQRSEEVGVESLRRATTKHTAYWKQVHNAFGTGGFEETAYPVNHQKRIFDRKEASWTGHGFCNISNNRLIAGYIANHAKFYTKQTAMYGQRLSAISSNLLGHCRMSLQHLCTVFSGINQASERHL